MQNECPLRDTELVLHFLLCYISFSCVSSLEELDTLNDRDNEKSESDCDEVFPDADVGKFECVCKEADLTYEGGRKKRACACDEESLVYRAETEGAASLGAHVEAVEYLSH